ncbi:MAG: DNA mismatch repair endonuclease MutL, partial [Lachnospiraceae bacterium]|nr:DNA mismatch repair endonuclease MutL [Lachnospiraceae bacterium]
MGRIHLLDTDTINKIKAGEVIERPASVIKELVENSIDSGADSVTVEIRNGGKTYMRVTDNGSGIAGEDVPLAFKSHATSKIDNADDLYSVTSLGFRGEALASIASVSRITMTTRAEGEITGSRFVIEGGNVLDNSETGCEQGTTVTVKDLFFNTPVREKYLKTAQTEGSYIKELMMKLCMASPGVNFTFISDGSEKISVSGRMDLSQLIYALFGREYVKQLVPVDREFDGFRISGFAGKPDLARGKRVNEIYFINGRYIGSPIISKAIEDAYKPYIMAHRFPFTVLYIEMAPDRLDVNIHPAKKDARILEQGKIYGYVNEAVAEALANTELIGDTGAFGGIPLAPDSVYTAAAERKEEPAFLKETEGPASAQNAALQDDLPYPAKYTDVLKKREEIKKAVGSSREIKKDDPYHTGKTSSKDMPPPEEIAEAIKGSGEISFLDPENSENRLIIGQVFGTYWLVESGDKLYMIDQHAAHEKVLYERFVKRLKEGKVPSQELLAPVVLTLDGNEAQILKDKADAFTAAGFEIDSFGGDEYALRAVPMDLYGFNAKELFLDMLDGFAGPGADGGSGSIYERIASMACKAAVKGNYRLSLTETESLINELMTLENPYNCPHG